MQKSTCSAVLEDVPLLVFVIWASGTICPRRRTRSFHIMILSRVLFFGISLSFWSFFVPSTDLGRSEYCVTPHLEMDLKLSIVP
jgi:hypothetical protein